VVDDVPSLGAVSLGGDRCRFCVWAPAARSVEVRLLSTPERLAPLEAGARGYHEAVVSGVPPGSLYVYRLDGATERPDPASRSQPQGVHGPSAVPSGRTFPWTDDGWTGLALSDYIIYELHVGTFTPEGTFEGVIRQLDELAALGVTAIELMPVAQFPGDRNWGYDGVYLYAVHPAYGGPVGLTRLVDACHARGMAVVLDVVYNHLGPEGNYLAEFGPYFTDRHRTPWGAALNLDGPDSDEVRRFFIENALGWVTEFHIDALRLDAVHAIVDQSARPFLAELAAAVHAEGERRERRIHVIAESDLNDPRLLRPPDRGGHGLDAQWSDDFHHALHVLLTGDRTGYYQDFGTVGDLMTALAEGFVRAGRYSAFYRRRYGAPSHDIPAERFVVCAQNHDQVGNRAFGERLSDLVSFEALKLAAGTLLLSPFVPLLFMGEEYAETAPFLYFTSHTDPRLAEAVRRGRHEGFASFAWRGEVPDPQEEAAFLRSRLTPALRREGRHRRLLELYTQLIRLRKTIPALARLCKETMGVQVWETERVVAVRRWDGESHVITALNFADVPRTVQVSAAPGRWLARLDSAEEKWGGPGRTVRGDAHSAGQIGLTVAATSFVLLSRDEDSE
jgi:maltooligosyltrehalose trehalohydrolase